jgi:hypothetical protein
MAAQITIEQLDKDQIKSVSNIDFVRIIFTTLTILYDF